MSNPFLPLVPEQTFDPVGMLKDHVKPFAYINTLAKTWVPTL